MTYDVLFSVASYIILTFMIRYVSRISNTLARRFHDAFAFFFGFLKLLRCPEMIL